MKNDIVIENQISNIKSQKHSLKILNGFIKRCYRFSITIIKLTKELPGKYVYRMYSDHNERKYWISIDTGSQSHNIEGQKTDLIFCLWF
jgi:hypothetical protein